MTNCLRFTVLILCLGKESPVIIDAIKILEQKVFSSAEDSQRGRRLSIINRRFGNRQRLALKKTLKRFA